MKNWKCKIFGKHVWTYFPDIGYKEPNGTHRISTNRICTICGKQESITKVCPPETQPYTDKYYDLICEMCGARLWTTNPHETHCSACEIFIKKENNS